MVSVVSVKTLPRGERCPNPGGYLRSRQASAAATEHNKVERKIPVSHDFPPINAGNAAQKATVPFQGHIFMQRDDFWRALERELARRAKRR